MQLTTFNQPPNERGRSEDENLSKKELSLILQSDGQQGKFIYTLSIPAFSALSFRTISPCSFIWSAILLPASAMIELLIN